MNNFQIETLTPVHVGNGRFLLNNTEYIAYRDRIGVISPEKFLELIGREKMDEWLSRIEKGAPLQPMLDDLDHNPELSDFSDRIIENGADDFKMLPNLKEQLHNATGHPYIPGSSIKGAIRSAVLSMLIRDNNQEIPYSQIQKNPDKLSAKFLEQKFFGQDPNHDIFRFLRIGDSCFEKGTTIALRMGNLNIKRNGAILDMSKQQLTEAINLGNKSGLSIKVDSRGLELNKEKRQIREIPHYFSGINILTQFINQHTAIVLDEEIEFWENEEGDDLLDYIELLREIRDRLNRLKEGECILRLGLGTGWTFISGNWMKNKNLFNEENLLSAVDKIRPKNFKYKEYPFPKSRRVSDSIDVPGFVRLTPA